MVYFSHYTPDDYSRVESDFLAHSANRAVFLAEDALGEQDDVVNRSKIKDDRLLRDINHRMRWLDLESVKPSSEVRSKRGFRKKIYSHNHPTSDDYIDFLFQPLKAKRREMRRRVENWEDPKETVKQRILTKSYRYEQEEKRRARSLPRTALDVGTKVAEEGDVVAAKSIKSITDYPKTVLGRLYETLMSTYENLHNPLNRDVDDILYGSYPRSLSQPATEPRRLNLPPSTDDDDDIVSHRRVGVTTSGAMYEKPKRLDTTVDERYWNWGSYVQQPRKNVVFISGTPITSQTDISDKLVDELVEKSVYVDPDEVYETPIAQRINIKAAASPKVQFSSHSYRSRSVGRAPSVPPMGVSYRASSVARRRAKSVEPIPISVDYSLRAHRRPMQDSLITDRLYLDRAYAAASGIADSTRGLDWDTGRHSILSPSFTPYGVSSYYSSVSRSRRASSVPPLPVYSSLYSRSVRRGGGEDKEQEYVYPGSHYPSFRSLVGHVSPYRSYSSYGLGQSGDRFSYSYGRSHPVPSGTTRIKVDLSGRGGEPDVRFYQPWRHSLVTSAPKRSPLHIEKRLLTMTEPDFPPPSHFRHLRTMLGELHNTMDKERMLIDRYLKEDLGPETTSQKTMKSVSSSESQGSSQ